MNERVLNYGTGGHAPRTDGASAWYCCWLALASVVLILVFLSGNSGSISYVPARVLVVFSTACGLAAIFFGVRCLVRRESDRGVAIFGLVVTLPALAGIVLAFGFWFDWINIGF